MGIDTIISLAIASLALLLSALSLYLQWRHNRVRLKVYPAIGTELLPSKSDGAGGYIREDLPVLRINLINPTEKAIHIKGVWIALKKDKEVELQYVKRTQDPIIESHRAFDFVFPVSQVLQILEREGYTDKVRIRIKVRDEVRNAFTSKPLKFSMGQLQMEAREV